MIKPLNTHYSFENPASIYDEEAMTALELAGRQGAKINEVINDQNELRQKTETTLEEQTNNIQEMIDVTMPAKVMAEIQGKIDNGEFEDAIDLYAGLLKAQLNNLLGAVSVGSTTMDAEVIDLRTDRGGFNFKNAGQASRKNMDSLHHVLKHLGIEELPVNNAKVTAGYYVSDSGALLANEKCSAYELTIPEGYSHAIILNALEIPVPGALVYGKGVKAVNKATQIYNVVGGATLKFSVFNDNSLVGCYRVYLVPHSSILFPGSVSTVKNLYQADALIDNNTVKEQAAISCYKILLKNGYVYRYHTSNAYDALTVGCYYNAQGEYLGRINLNPDYTFSPPINCTYMIVNVASSQMMDYVSEEVVPNTVTVNPMYHVVNRPFNFEGKTAVFFGDSITQGVTLPGTPVTDYNYPNLFSRHVGLSHINKGVGGALITPGINGSEDILSTVKKTTLNQDFVFVSAGTNDYTLGVNLADFEAHTRNLFTYLKSNYSGTVIVIAPIDRVRSADVKFAGLDEYRKILCKLALEFEFNFVNGKLFNFPEEAGELCNAVFADTLHPSEQGYRQYARALATTLC